MEAQIPEIDVFYNKMSFPPVVRKTKELIINQYNEQNELENKIHSYCTDEIKICDFDGYGIIQTISGKTIEFEKTLYAQFFTTKTHIELFIEPYDVDVIYYKNVKNNIDYYNEIYDRMKYYEKLYKNDVEKYKDIKDKFVGGFILLISSYIKCKNKVLEFVDNYIKENNEYKYIRIYQKRKQI